jgi:hypothetical protein
MAKLESYPSVEDLIRLAPDAGFGLHRWQMKGARECATFRVPIARAREMIAATVAAKGGEVIWTEIDKALSKAYSTTLNGGTYTPRPKWPEPDLELIEQITLEEIDRNPNQLAVLESLSADTLDHTTQEIITRLFPADAWLSVGVDATDKYAFPLRNITNRLDRYSFIVPNEMKGASGRTQDGREAGRCLDNVKERRFLVCEFDWTEFSNARKPTIWKPLIEKWRAAGATPQDAMSVIIQKLGQYAPLVLVTFSGSKSLHAWLYCLGQPEDGMMSRFMTGAVKIGADPAAFVLSQFVRMPGGWNHKHNVRQSVHYLNFQNLCPNPIDGQSILDRN